MTTKTTTAKEPAKSRTEHGGSSRESLEAAYRIHTLVQMFYAQVAATQPWMLPVFPPTAGIGPVAPADAVDPQGPFAGGIAPGLPPLGGAPFPMGMPAAGMQGFSPVPPL